MKVNLDALASADLLAKTLWVFFGLNLKCFFIVSGTRWKEHGGMAITCGLVTVDG